KPDTLAGKMTRVELGVRIVQVDLLLGDKGSGKYAKIGITPQQAQAVRGALEKTDLKTLNDLGERQTRALLWETLGAANMSYRFSVEGVDVAGAIDDRELLERHLTLLKEGWAKASGDRLKLTNQPVEEWMRSILLDTLRFQSVGALQEALDQTSDL